MNNKIKILTIAVLISSVAHVDAKTDSILNAGSVVKTANKINEYFPGTWPLNKVEKRHLESLAAEWNVSEYERRLPSCLFNENTGICGSYSLADWVQLSGTALFKWLPAFLIARGIYRKLTKKKQPNRPMHGDDCQHGCSH